MKVILAFLVSVAAALAGIGVALLLDSNKAEPEPFFLAAAVVLLLAILIRITGGKSK